MMGSREIGDVQGLVGKARHFCDTLIPPPLLVVDVTKASRVHENERSRLLSLSACVVLPKPARGFASFHEVGDGVPVYTEYLGHLPKRLLYPQAGWDPLAELAPLPDQGAGETGLRFLRQPLPRLIMPVVR